MPPKKKPASAEVPTSKVGGMFGWCLLPQHDICPGETNTAFCKCSCHEVKETKSE
jgi:hypothetical protein